MIRSYGLSPQAWGKCFKKQIQNTRFAWLPRATKASRLPLWRMGPHHTANLPAFASDVPGTICEPMHLWEFWFGRPDKNNFPTHSCAHWRPQATAGCCCSDISFWIWIRKWLTSSSANKQEMVQEATVSPWKCYLIIFIFVKVDSLGSANAWESGGLRTGWVQSMPIRMSSPNAT